MAGAWRAQQQVARGSRRLAPSAAREHARMRLPCERRCMRGRISEPHTKAKCACVCATPLCATVPSVGALREAPSLVSRVLGQGRFANRPTNRSRIAELFRAVRVCSLRITRGWRRHRFLDVRVARIRAYGRLAQGEPGPAISCGSRMVRTIPSLAAVIDLNRIVEVAMRQPAVRAK